MGFPQHWLATVPVPYGKQDADVVAFVDRAEAYRPDSADKGTVELVIAKHCNGPTAKIRLAFLEHLTQCADMVGCPPPLKP